MIQRIPWINVIFCPDEPFQWIANLYLFWNFLNIVHWRHKNKIQYKVKISGHIRNILPPFCKGRQLCGHEVAFKYKHLYKSSSSRSINSNSSNHNRSGISCSRGRRHRNSSSSGSIGGILDLLNTNRFFRTCVQRSNKFVYPVASLLFACIWFKRGGSENICTFHVSVIHVRLSTHIILYIKQFLPLEGEKASHTLSKVAEKFFFFFFLKHAYPSNGNCCPTVPPYSQDLTPSPTPPCHPPPSPPPPHTHTHTQLATFICFQNWKKGSLERNMRPGWLWFQLYIRTSAVGLLRSLQRRWQTCRWGILWKRMKKKNERYLSSWERIKSPDIFPSYIL